MVDILDFYLQSQNYEFITLTGSVPQKDRMRLVDRFQTDPKIFIFLISTLAGGTGLNLTAANKVVIFDPNWNPAHDLQAMDRAHRYGQTRDVNVYRLLGAGSIEELIYARQVYKQQQMAIGYNASTQTRYFAGVQGDPTKQGELFGLSNIFKLDENFSSTQMVIEKASMRELDWALKNMKQKPINQPKVRSKVEKLDVQAMENAMTKEDSAFAGLASLLFDDTVEPIKDKASDPLSKMYTHHNDQLLVPSHREQDKARNLRGRSKNSKPRADPNWPPIRRRQKVPALGEDQIHKSRISALIMLGHINNTDELGPYSQAFSKKPKEEQEALISRLDQVAREYGL